MGKLLLGEDSLLHDGDFVQLIKRPFTNIETGGSGHWECIRRKTHGRIVSIAPITEYMEIVLIKVFRVPLKSYVVEVCSGLSDREGEDEECSVQRELLEETGYRCRLVEPVISGPYNAGLSSDQIVCYVGYMARRIAEPKLEDAEDIEVLLIPLRHLRHFLTHQPAGVLIDIKIWSFIPFLASWCDE